MATLHSCVDAAGRPVVRCFVKGAAPAVMARAATALSRGESGAWTADTGALTRTWCAWKAKVFG